jgi:two-component system LytT family sensor kinase
MTPPVTGLLLDLLGFLTGTALYVMLVLMVWRERVAEGMPFLSRRGRLPLLTGLCGLLWNLGALVSFGIEIAGGGSPIPVVVAIAFAALGFLPAIVIHSLLDGRQTGAGRQVVRPAILAAYLLSTVAAILHGVEAFHGVAAPSRPGLWLLTGGFIVLTAVLLVVTREQPIGRRGMWVASLSIFAVSALHFSRHVGNESWWVELLGHHASLPLALAILHQDHRFALADLFLKNAIALLLLLGLTFALFSGVMVPILHWPGGVSDPRVIALLIVLWMATALVFPPMRRWAGRLVDRAVLRRPNYEVTLAEFAQALDAAEAEDTVITTLTSALQQALAITEVRPIDDLLPEEDRRPIVTGPELRTWVTDPAIVLVLRLRTVEPKHPALALGPLAAGRRLLSDDLHFLESMAQAAARRIDGLRVTQERLERNVREREMRRLATEAELRAIRAQLHPHFLFNALTTLGYLIQTSPPRALDTLLRLTTLLRGVLRRSTSEFCTLGEEIDLIASYLEIEHARFEDRLDVSIDVAPNVRDCLIPTLLLQPLVENAVKHGLSAQRAGGALRIAAQAVNGRLRITVEDSGVGFEPGSAHASLGVGLRSVAERLRAHYGPKAAFTIHSAPERGTTVEIELPPERDRPRQRRPQRRVG